MQALIARRARRGLTWDELSAESGVPRSTLHWWDRRLRAGTDRSTGDRFIEVATDGAAAPEPITIVLRSGIELRVAAGFDRTHLRRLVAVLEPGC